MKRVVIIALMLTAISGTTTVNAQSWLRGLGRAAENAAKRAVERNVESATERAIDRAFSETEDAVEDAVRGESSNQGKKNKNKNKNNDNNNADAQGYDNGDTQGYDNVDGAAQAKPQKGQSLEMTYAKSDFVAGDEIIFEDNLANEQMGEFPSQWDLIEGSVEVANIAGRQCIYFDPMGATVAPLMKDMKSYLPDVFTLELDFFANRYGSGFCDGYYFRFYNAEKRVLEIDMNYTSTQGNKDIHWNYDTPSGDYRVGDARIIVQPEAWNHLAISFNKRALKVYVNGIRIANIPNMAAPVRFVVVGREWGTADTFREAITNIRLAQGAVPLYDRMMSDGKFITYGITFDVGKATIKPESMGEINRIVQLMTENPDLKFSVEGHTDSTGNPASNQTLSEQRSQAIVAKLVELGIAQDRLTAVGKGQNSPIADNSTDEGRAKNRRVEFVKM